MLVMPQWTARGNLPHYNFKQFYLRLSQEKDLIRTCSGPTVKPSLKNHIVHVGGPCYKVPSLIVTRFQYMWGNPISRFPSLTVTRFPHTI